MDAARGRFPTLPAPVVADALQGGPQLRRALAFMAQIQERSAAHSEPFRLGTVFSDPARPALWDLNFARLEVPGGGLDAAEVSEETEAAQAASGHAHRKLYVADAGTAVALAPGLRDLGWRLERYLVMALVDPPSPGRYEVGEVSHADLEPSRRTFVRGDDSGLTDAVVAQLVDFAAARRRATEVRVFVHREKGVPVSWCELYSGGGVGQVEDVATLREHRGRGYASSVVAHATRASVEAGHHLTFLVVDEVEGPVVLYRRLGYAGIGREYAFFKPPPQP